MNMTETAAVLAKVRLGDGRKEPDEAMLREWHDVIGDLDLDEAIAAVIEFRKTQPGSWLNPGYLIGIAKKWREAAAEKRHHDELALLAPNADKYPVPPRDILKALELAWNDERAYADAEERLNDWAIANGRPPTYDTFKAYRPIGWGNTTAGRS